MRVNVLRLKACPRVCAQACIIVNKVREKCNADEAAATDEAARKQVILAEGLAALKANKDVITTSIGALFFTFYQADSPYRTPTFDIVLTLLYWRVALARQRPAPHRH